MPSPVLSLYTYSCFCCDSGVLMCRLTCKTQKDLTCSKHLQRTHVDISNSGICLRARPRCRFPYLPDNKQLKAKSTRDKRLLPRPTGLPPPSYGRTGRPAGDHTQAKPGQRWRSLLLDPAPLAWVFNLQAGCDCGDNRLGAAARQLIVRTHALFFCNPSVLCRMQMSHRLQTTAKVIVSIHMPSTPGDVLHHAHSIRTRWLCVSVL